MVQYIEVEAGKILGVRMIFAQIHPNLPEKFHKKVTYKKSVMLFRVPFLLIFSGVC